MPKRPAIEALPEAVRKWLDQALAQGNFSGYEQLEVELKNRGFQIGKSSIHRYGQKLERKLAAIKASTQAAAAIAEAAPDDADLRSAAVISLVQTEVFDVLVTLQEAEVETDPAERLKLLGQAAKSIAELSRASVNQKKWQTQVEAQVRADERAKAAEAATSSAKAAGVSAETIAIIRRDVLGMAA
jgi:hypothetical protein